MKPKGTTPKVEGPNQTDMDGSQSIMLWRDHSKIRRVQVSDIQRENKQLVETPKENIFNLKYGAESYHNHTNTLPISQS